MINSETDRNTAAPGETRVSAFSRHGIFEPPIVVGSSAALQSLLHVASRIARRSAKVLITGESGVGKDIIARFIHSQSKRSDQKFIAINCASVSETLLESELFGHVKGSFTGAHRDKIGKLQQAHGGTMFLDEIAEMSVRMQALLLRFLENGEIQPVGSDAPPIRADVRVISATHRDLAGMVSKGEFRQDLLYRINGFQINLAPLRERPEDIDPLSKFLLKQVGGTVQPQLTDEALSALRAYGWPGNVRQLKNCLERAVILSNNGRITLSELPPEVVRPVPAATGIANVVGQPTIAQDGAPSAPVGAPGSLREVERQQILAALEQTGWHRGKTAEILGISPSTLYRRLRDYDLERRR